MTIYIRMEAFRSTYPGVAPLLSSIYFVVHENEVSSQTYSAKILLALKWWLIACSGLVLHRDCEGTPQPFNGAS